ncbi:hypothetical protein KP509_35G007100 [Ceratopteris richardii]|nr:hypothetical protein KP509_35G007100 [Ceratopteris richardii]
MVILGATFLMNVRAITMELPPVISSCLSPMNISSSLRWKEEMSYGEPLHNVSAFCQEGGLICDQDIETPPVILYRFSRYRMNSIHPAASMHDKRLFFNESELSVGNTMELPDQEPHIPTRAFLPPTLEPLLFNSSGSRLSHVLHVFGFEPYSHLAQSMNDTLELCNHSSMEGETRTCVATFEDMLAFAMSLTGSYNFSILAGDVLQPQGIVKVLDLQEMTNEGQSASIACHNAMFPFQVFYCHYIRGTKVFNVTLEIETTNEIIMAIASCHPRVRIPLEEFHVPKIQNELLCHWNFGDNIVWVPQQSILTQSSHTDSFLISQTTS